MNVSTTNRYTPEKSSYYKKSPALVVTNVKEKLFDPINAFNAPQRRFGEIYDSSSHAAVIKMIMIKFGQNPTDMFKTVTRTGEFHDVTLRDGTQIQISDNELKQTAAASRFIGNDDSVIRNANFALCVFVKHKQMSSSKNGNHQGFERVLSNSLQGETSFNVLKGLGMAGLIRQIPSEALQQNGGIGVMTTDNFGACLVKDDAGHDYGRRRPIDRPYIYVLDENKASAVSKPTKISSVPVSTTSPVAVPVLDQTSELSNKRNGEKPSDIVRGFDAEERPYETRIGFNRIANVIKVLMLNFGQSPTDVFEKVTPAGDGYDVTMRDGYQLHVSKDELKRTAKVSTFSGTDDGAVKDANFMLAAYVKRKQHAGIRGYTFKDFNSALNDTQVGDASDVIFDRLGMSAYMISAYPDKVGKKGAIALGGKSDGYELVIDSVMYKHGKQKPYVGEGGYMIVMPTPDTSPIEPNKKISNLSSMPVGKKPRDIWSGLSQGSENNCVTVSSIKAAMLKFGQHPQGIFKRITETSEGYTVTMRDSFTLRLTHDELKKARSSADFYGDDQGMLNDAIFLYAASAKREQMLGQTDKSFESAMDHLNSGAMPDEAFMRLGLGGRIRGSSAEELANGALGILGNFQHSVVVTDGFLDNRGQKIKLSGSEWMHGSSAVKLV
ncbi:hypothetical protein [Pseudomonas sp. L1(2025)]|uniref:hypothetical protein n=1 Tax=Pseudomonas sp. L1(2025) TaxID=3449429 RepID=UPI003F68BEAA